MSRCDRIKKSVRFVDRLCATTTDPAAKDTGVGSRPMGPAKDEKPTDPNTPKQPEIKKQEKEGTNK